MIDRAARIATAEALTHFVSCRITNDQFEDILAVSKDPAITAVTTMAWHLYDDLHEHRMNGLHRLSRRRRRDIARWILFLHSDLPYEWPRSNFIGFFAASDFLDFLTRGWWGRRQERRFDTLRQAGEWDVWPFIRAADFAAARHQPRLLAGRSR